MRLVHQSVMANWLDSMALNTLQGVICDLRVLNKNTSSIEDKNAGNISEATNAVPTPSTSFVLQDDLDAADAWNNTTGTLQASCQWDEPLEDVHRPIVPPDIEYQPWDDNASHPLCKDAMVLFEELDAGDSPFMKDAEWAGSTAHGGAADFEKQIEEGSFGKSVLSLPEKAQSQGHYEFPPDRSEAQAALNDITEVLSPIRAGGRGHKHFKGDQVSFKRLVLIQGCLRKYLQDTVNGASMGWGAASLATAHHAGKGLYAAQKLRQWCRAYIADRNDLPFNTYGLWTTSLLQEGELAKEIVEHLQSIGKFVRAQDVVDYLAQNNVQERYGYEHNITLRTAQRWMLIMDYRFAKSPRGQYVDGHEREDVVRDRQDGFLPAMLDILPYMCFWKVGDELTESDFPPIWPRLMTEVARKMVEQQRQEESSGKRKRARRVVVWWHDECTYFANDRCNRLWVHKDAKAIPEPKGEGSSLMVADFISADYGWLRNVDGSSARVLFKAGKNRDGYFNNNNIISHVEAAMEIIKERYPNDDHVFVFDNATTHRKREDDALSASSMTKGPSDKFSPVRKVFGPDGKPIFNKHGKQKVEKIHMQDGWFHNAQGMKVVQSFYFPEDHPTHPGQFKGILQILLERGFNLPSKLRLECRDFKCQNEGPEARCCCRRILYNQPDFQEVKSRLENVCASRGFRVIFLPKFHPELNFIEQCWGAAKRHYRKLPQSKSDQEFERNVIESLESVSLLMMRRLVICHALLLTNQADY
jgi:hypothetical protein